MAKAENLADKVDRNLEKPPGVRFVWRVIKKYQADDGSKLGALITYYGFLSLFPLLLAVTSGLQLFLKHHEATRIRLAEGISHYFPVISSELQTNIHTLHRTGLALVIGIILTLYGARGGADAIRHAFNVIWKVPKSEQPGFFPSILNSFKLIFFGGGGLVLAAVLSSYAAGISSSEIFRGLSFILSFLVLTEVFYMAFKIVVAPKSHHTEGLFTSAITAAIGVEVLQIGGGYVLTHQLKHLTTLYGTFAVVLGLMFWIYLQVQVLLFAAEAGSIRASRP